MKTLKVLLQEVVSGIKAWVNSNFAQESNTVHKTGNETVNGNKYLTGYFRHTLTYDYIQTTAFDVRTDPEADRGRDIFRIWEGDSSSLGDYLGGMSYFQETDGSSRLQLICFGYPTSGNAYQRRINFHAYRDGSSSFYPVHDSINLGTSTNQWKSVYAQSYYYNGTAWGLDKENTWTGNNSFTTDIVINSSASISEQPSLSSSRIKQIIFNDSSNSNYFYRLRQVVTDTSSRLQSNVQVFDSSGNAYSSTIAQRINADGTSSLYPGDNSIDLGTSTNKWKSFNGLNPGALSFPDYNNILDVTSEVPIASLDGNTTIDLNDYLADKTGWLSIVIDDTAGNFITVTQGRTGGQTAFNNSRTFHTGAQSNGYISVFFPIIASMSKIAFIKASSLIQMRFYLCLGNV